jgi:XRE family aerobic/anaerobic benzoate catabolism transcriptional regulator
MTLSSRSSGVAPGPEPVLTDLARRVREARRERGWTRVELAERSGLSVRFLARVESGQGNISVLRLHELAGALGTSATVLLRPYADPDRIVTLVGLRGAGKSTIGPLLAERRGVPFIEMDTLIREASGLPLDQLFELHGERYYRRLERETLRDVLSRGEPAILAAAGGVVNEPATWELLREGTFVIWLTADPEDHWNRVVAQGDRRPMRDNPAAMDELRGILRAREPVYAEARLRVNTSGSTPEQVVSGIERALDPDTGGAR